MSFEILFVLAYLLIGCLFSWLTDKVFKRMTGSNVCPVSIQVNSIFFWLFIILFIIISFVWEYLADIVDLWVAWLYE